ncbi:transcriptional regulator, TetR family [Pseudonocardia thermophila]|uniref:Transcriptional regulator, TetR family n=1 Tax=Pseudonocardia thermophila TaxID=1848 RepID=A0A1M6YI10_PSETH|nr:TetR/AcrR family transcriptional regulator [Pseudonocardia thermophila]SHL17887.1 transcriptional regulator, TetR family [Pseudonocardia thermophila]
MSDVTPLEAVWTATPGPAPREGLTLDRVVEAAMAIADAEGLDAVSMSRVAKRLGFTPMAIYRHVANKEELLLHMQNRAVGVPPPEIAPTGDWRADITRWAWAGLAGVRAHPWYVQTLSLVGAPATPNQLLWIEAALQALAPTTLTEAEKIETILLINAHVIADTTFRAIDDAATATGSNEKVMARAMDPERFPAFVRAAAAGAFAPGPDPAAERDELFRFGLERILDGVEAYLSRSA